MDTGLKQKVVLVTGASKGIGRAIARGFAREGARLVLTYRSDEAAAMELVHEIEAAGGEAIAARLDLHDRGSIAAALRAGFERFGGIDVVVANAVLWPTRRPDRGRFENIDPDDWREMLAANVEGTVATISGALPSMRERGWGRIVLISSSVAEEGQPGPSPYGPAKATYMGIARQLAWDAGRDGILVNVVGTGFTVTERNLEHFPDESRERVAALTPSGRLSTPDDVATLVVFLGSAANRNITGEIVYEGSSNGRSAHVPSPAG
jgi:NAD(P)-dependent dehydrogenase (short-subunit alcohol dehydrogenase family)